MKFHYSIKHRGMFGNTINSLTLMNQQWDRETKCRGQVERIINLKRQTLEASGYGTSVYPGLCGYLQAIITVLTAHYPKEALEWLINEADTLETDLPFVILKHSTSKEEQ